MKPSTPFPGRRRKAAKPMAAPTPPPMAVKPRPVLTLKKKRGK